jgi:hypothetical protein
MSKIELRDKIFLLIDQHSENERWLLRLYGLLAEMEIETEDVGDWEELSPGQEVRLEESRKQHREGKVISHQQVIERSSKWHSK